MQGHTVGGGPHNAWSVPVENILWQGDRPAANAKQGASRKQGQETAAGVLQAALQDGRVHPVKPVPQVATLVTGHQFAYTALQGSSQ